MEGKSEKVENNERVVLALANRAWRNSLIHLKRGKKQKIQAHARRDIGDFFLPLPYERYEHSRSIIRGRLNYSGFRRDVHRAREQYDEYEI